MYEEFKDIVGYENLYQISNKGRVKSLKFNKERILKPRDKNGYYKITLHKDGLKKECRIHQLVAVTFLNHTLCGNSIVVNHIDGDKTNNAVENLELISSAENTVDGLLRNKNIHINIKNNIKYIAIKQFEAYYTYDNEQILIGTFKSIRECVIAIESIDVILNIINAKNPIS